MSRSRRGGARSGWLARQTLRTRLGLATIALMAAVSLVIGLVSVGALKLFLEQRLDDSLISAGRRSRIAVDRPIVATNQPPASIATRGSGPGQGPGFLFAPGQGQGTLGAMIDSAPGITRAAVLDGAGAATPLTAAQRDQLATIPVDERPHTVDFGGDRGDYRLLAQRTSRGQTIITGLPLNPVRGAVLQLLAVVSAVSALGLLAVALLGAAIVRRTLRPLNRVAATATQVAQLPLDRGEVALAVRVPEADTNVDTEVGQVGAALNRMLGHVGEALAARQASIPAQLLPEVFERFTRGDVSRSRGVVSGGSTGLGLSIVAAVVAAHGGTVDVESRPGGTEFTVRLPLAAGPAATVPAETSGSEPIMDGVHSPS